MSFTPQKLLEHRKSLLESLQSDFLVRRLDQDHYTLRTKFAETDTPAIDRGKMAVPCTITTQDEDRQRDIVVTAGIDLSKHKTNPVVLYNHGYGGVKFPVGKAEDSEGAYQLVRSEGKVRSVTYFSQKNLESEQIFQLVEEGILRGVSIGFQIKTAEYRRDKSPEEYDGWPGLLISKCELFEYSHVSIPANPEALADRIGKGMLAGRPISETILKSLTPYLPDRAVQVTGGFEPRTIPEGKSMTTPAIAEPTPNPTPTPAPVPTPAPAPVAQGPAPVPAPSRKSDDDYVPVNVEPEVEVPPGAKAIMGCFDRFYETAEYLVGVAAKQENERVRSVLDDLADLCERQTDELESFFLGEYPDLKDMLRKREEDTSDSDEGKSLDLRFVSGVQSLAGRLKSVRAALNRSREENNKLAAGARGVLAGVAAYLDEVGASSGIGQTQKTAATAHARSLRDLGEKAHSADAEELARVKEANAQLQKRLQDAQDNHAKLAREMRRVINGR